MSLEHPLLRACGVRHAFGTRADSAPAGLRTPQQVHGARVVRAEACSGGGAEGDAVVARASAAPIGVVPIGIVTADCVPVLAAAADGGCVAAIHAGWRGLAAGVVEAAIDALRSDAGGRALHAVIGPHIEACCYEVDAPVLDALRHRFDAELDATLRDSRPGHFWLDLGALTRCALVRAGVSATAIGTLENTCTACDAERFHSYRRDGPRAGRLVHWIAARSLDSPRGAA